MKFVFKQIENTNLLIMASSSDNLKILGFDFPSCGNGVTVPISKNPTPVQNNPEGASTFLSNPAAIPIGFENSRPNTSVFYEELKNIYSIIHYTISKISVIYSKNYAYITSLFNLTFKS